LFIFETVMIEELYEYFLKSTGVSIDTRTVKEGEIFFALNGPNFNANKFAEKALEAGAILAVVDDAAYVKGDHYILVNDGLEALQQLANSHRKQLNIPFIGITGSNGKTTTKELMRDVLAKKYNIVATIGNLNNHIGVPLTLLSIAENTEIAIIEMGANHIGEIEALCKIVEPTHGLITNIGEAHLEGFGSIEGVIRGKSELYNFLIQNEGLVFVNSQNEILANMAKRRMSEPVFYGTEGDFFTATLLTSTPLIEYETDKSDRTCTQLSGGYNFENITAALCVGRFFDVEENSANEAVANYTPDNNRSQLIEQGGIKIILDAYNANPSSMKAALENLAKLEGSKAVILGDMFELGESSEASHVELGKLTADLRFDKVIFCGELSKSGKEGNPDALYFITKMELATYLVLNPIVQDYLLIKGSRGMGLETLLKCL
jgi:UDP-N-acetylmuramoyl-tripeptide--D-alanyl-D-alanine ligase